MRPLALLLVLLACAGSEAPPAPSAPNAPPAGGPLLAFYLVLSFILALFWLLVIANELVGTALAFGKILKIPDTVMGLGILAVG
jgi:hypothetical protein